ncbi:MAG: hypothetical protein K1Y36_00970 [Blastocatellia bacterium]|nr:hypothetical protein [Blastocatellia bacterium]
MKISLWKSLFGLVCAAVVTLALQAPVLAQGPFGPQGPPDPAKTVAGKLTAVGTSSLTITTPESKQETVLVTAQTTYNRNRAAATLASFVVNDFVRADGARNSAGQLVADKVSGGDKAPRDGGPGGGPKGRGPAGEFVSADTSAGSFVVKVKDGSTKTVLTDAETKIERNRQTATLADFKAGDHIAAEGRPNESGQFVAKRVHGGDAPPDKTNLMAANSRVVFGDVVSVNPVEGTVVIIGQNGIEQTVTVAPQALIHRNGEPVGLDALRQGDLIKAVGTFDDAGHFTIRFIRSSGLPDFE